MRNLAAKTGKVRLQAFMRVVMEPLPPEMLEDTQHEALMQKVRIDRWCAAENATRYYETLRTFSLANDLHKGPGLGIAVPSYDKVLVLLRQAIADQLLTPAPRKAELEWKKRQRLDMLPVSKDAVAKVIAADEAFVAEKTMKRGRCV